MVYPPQGSPKAETWTYTQLEGGENKKPSADSTWEDWDLVTAGIVPNTVKAVEVTIKRPDVVPGTAVTMGARKNGTAITPMLATTRYAYRGYVSCLVECDDNGVIEIYDSSIAANIDFEITGYWGEA